MHCRSSLCYLLFLAFLALPLQVFSYKPIFMMHGISANEGDWTTFKKYVAEAHPGTLTYALPLFDNIPGSLTPLLEQAQTIGDVIRNITKQPGWGDGYHLVCHSQGALTRRAVLEVMDDHKVDTFISLAGPQMGEYGAFEFLRFLFPNISVPNVWRLFYNDAAQDTLSVANFWNDPHQHKEYLEKVKFLPVVNNEVDHPDSKRFKRNFVRTSKIVLFGSNADEEILPWQSSMFSFYAPYSNQLLPITQQPVFLNDTFGLKTMYQSGRLILNPVDGVTHNDWRVQKSIFQKYLEPLLV